MKRADCEFLPRPCPHTSCRYNLTIREKPSTGARYTRPLGNSGGCALDVADEGDHTLDEVAEVMGVSRQRVQQIELIALRRLRRKRVTLDVLQPHMHADLEQRYGR